MPIQFHDSGIIYIDTSIQQQFKKSKKLWILANCSKKKMMMCKYRREFTFQVGTDKMFIYNLLPIFLKTTYSFTLTPHQLILVNNINVKLSYSYWIQI